MPAGISNPSRSPSSTPAPTGSITLADPTPTPPMPIALLPEEMKTKMFELAAALGYICEPAAKFLKEYALQIGGAMRAREGNFIY